MLVICPSRARTSLQFTGGHDFINNLFNTMLTICGKTIKILLLVVKVLYNLKLYVKN